MSLYRMLLNIVAMALFILVGCTSQQEEATSTPEPTVESTAIPTEAEEPTATEEATPEVDANVTEEPSETEDPVVSVCPDDSYYIALSYTVEEFDEDYPEPETGQRWFVVVATLANQAGEAIEVGESELALIDTQGNRYSPEEPDENTQPPLVGAELAEGESLLGLVRFSIPESASPRFLEWALDDECGQPIRTQIN